MPPGNAALALSPIPRQGSGQIRSAQRPRGSVDARNRNDAEMVHAVSNSTAFDRLNANVSRLECPDPDIERAYTFRTYSRQK
jgi:hypothetical protein